eukprot:CAMPEP_0201719938 /NCGR_PEP_ID=MMETSP0593-20130828/4991_1 /ASSEMBLY_ACC=CAM_ASM_000672 /TAXON_ID=267983 /ORGANISM="Skeletonema japonicum, Strain CCMP2506" /LENGTH=347 /DNA_ID=CAMNT_0048210461 /DNA_START=188 /DNA_END=1232 /DNA_ORIENTATION=+
MAAEGGGNIVWFTEGDIVWFFYTGEEGIPNDATHIFVDAKVIPSMAFCGRLNIVEVVCDENVETIEKYAFYGCRSLRRLIMPGVEIVEDYTFFECDALKDVECGKLERIREGAFTSCKSLSSINLPSVKVVERDTFFDCTALTDVKFSSKLDTFAGGAPFRQCISLQRITIPLKDNMIPDDRAFRGCANLNSVDLVEGVLLHEVITALQLEEWTNDMNVEINSINQILPTAPAGSSYAWDFGLKAEEIRRWIRSVLAKLHHYKAEHQLLLNEAATTLQHTLPQDIVSNKVLPFLELPSDTFEGENHEAEEDEESNEEVMDEEVMDEQEKDEDQGVVGEYSCADLTSV